MLRNTIEERVMRYTAVCTSFLADRVEELEDGNENSTKRIAEAEGSLGALVVQQAKLVDKVTLLEWDFNLNLKYWFQVVNFEAQMLGFGLTESVLNHQERVHQEQVVQEELGALRDRLAGAEETLARFMGKVC
jgi:hypothetical protein